MRKLTKSIWTVPNLLSLLRLALVPVFLLCFFSSSPNAHVWAMAVFLTAGVTDLLDGWIARRFHQISLAGRILDPLADKLMVVCALGSLAAADIIPLWLVLLYAAKEALQGLCGLILMRRTRDMLPSNIIGKAGTVFFYVTIVTLTLLQPADWVKSLLLTLSYITILAAFCSYLVQAVRQGLTTKPDSEE